MKSTLAPISAATLLLLASAPAVWAVAPANDVFTGATTATIGFSETLDTTEATTDSDDAQLNSACGAPATDASVWYAIAGTDQTVTVDVSQSDYSAGVLVGTGTQGSLTIVTCGPGAVTFFAASGTTYYVLAIDDQLGAGNGGTLAIAFNVVMPPSLDVAVNRGGTASSRTGVARISGTYVCSNADYVDLQVTARETVGRFTIVGSGEFFQSGTCDGMAHAWSADIAPQNGKFAGGKAFTVTNGQACATDCAFDYVEQTVQLKSTK